MAVDVITHEAFHLRGIQDEARTECSSLQTMAATAQALGATPAQGAALARGQLAEAYPLMPDQYRSAECADGGELDLRPDDPTLPLGEAERREVLGQAPARRARRRAARRPRAWW